MKLVLPRMRRRGGGHVINVASAGSFVAAAHEATYAATKQAVKGVCDGLRPELRGSGIELTLVYPAVVRTELAAGTTPGRTGAWVEPHEVADAIVACVRSPRREVFVPRRLAGLLRFYGAAPGGRQARAEPRPRHRRVAMKTDNSARAEYERRMAVDTE